MMNENDHSFGKKIPETNACKKQGILPLERMPCVIAPKKTIGWSP